MKARQASDPPFPPESSTGPAGDADAPRAAEAAADAGLPEEFTMPPTDPGPTVNGGARPATRLGAATLTAAIARLGGVPARTERNLYRVVEVGRDGEGRLSRQGRIWHRDLDMVRRFGRALASNSAADRVLVSDSAGTVLETIAPPGPDKRPAGWSGWREQPLPPLPLTRRPTRASGTGALPRPSDPAAPAPERALQAALDAALDAGLHAPRSPTGAAPVPPGLARTAPAAPAVPPRDVPSLEVESEVERTRTLLP